MEGVTLEPDRLDCTDNNEVTGPSSGHGSVRRPTRRFGSSHKLYFQQLWAANMSCHSSLVVFEGGGGSRVLLNTTMSLSSFRKELCKLTPRHAYDTKVILFLEMAVTHDRWLFPLKVSLLLLHKPHSHRKDGLFSVGERHASVKNKIS